MSGSSDISAGALAEQDELWMRCALELAQKAASIGEAPVGCVIVCGGKIVGSGWNTRESDKNALAHAELTAINAACRTLGGWRLPGCSIYVTLEPCAMCAGAIVNARLETLVYAAPDSKAGACGGLFDLFSYGVNHKPLVRSGCLQSESAELLKSFFSALRKKI